MTGPSNMASLSAMADATATDGAGAAWGEEVDLQLDENGELMAGGDDEHFADALDGDDAGWDVGDDDLELPPDLTGTTQGGKMKEAG